MEAQKLSKWAKPNKGLADRLSRQESSSVRLGAVERSSLESSQAALEKKAKIYDALRKGGTAGLSERQLEGVLVDVSFYSISRLEDPRG